MRSNISVLPQRRENRILKRGDIYYADLMWSGTVSWM